MARLGTRIVGALAPERRRLRKLQMRIERLEDEMQEARQLNRRIAEIADVVQELLIPAAERDDERVKQLLEDYRKGL
jgi:hypothetical protein